MKAPRYKKLLTVEQAARKLEVSEMSIRRWIADGMIPSVTKQIPVTYVPAVALKDVMYINCLNCGKRVKVKRPKGKKFCSDRCQKKWRAGQKGKKSRKK